MSLILSIAAAAMAQSVPPPATEVTPETDDKDKLICKRFPPPVGSRLRGRKICATKQEWKIQEEARDTAMDNLQGRTGYEENPSGGGGVGTGP